MKMNQKVLAIIIPTYNMENYLSYCLDSFLIKKNRDKLEVIIVNDGSKDRSLVISQEYISRDSDVFKLIDKKNGNYGSCINAALPVVTAKYVKVVDADDSVDSENLDDFISFLDGIDVDLALSDFVLVNENRVVTKEISYYWGVTQAQMNQICTTERFMDMEMHAVTYRRDLLLNANYVQTEGISYTDQQWIFAPMAFVQTVGVFNKTVYKYLVGREGQTINPEIKLKKISDRTKCTLDMIIQYDKLNKKVSPEIRTYLNARLRPNVQDIYITYFSNDSKINRNVIYSFDEAFKQASQSYYNYIGEINLHIKLWRKLIEHPVSERIFNKCFTFILWFKIALGHSNNK